MNNEQPHQGTDQVTRLRYVEFVYEDYRVHLEKDKDSPSAPVIAVVGIYIYFIINFKTFF